MKQDLNNLVKELETEYKAMLTKDKLEYLKNFFREFTEEQELYTQTNYYFDVEGHSFIKNRITIRIRHKQDRWYLQIKIPDVENIKGNYSQQFEINRTLEEAEARNLIKNGFQGSNPYVEELFTLIHSEPISLFMIGSLVTRRQDYLFYTDIISIDENEYLGKVDYELEWETTNHRFVPYLFAKLGIQPTRGVGKIKRFMERLKKIT